MKQWQGRRRMIGLRVAAVAAGWIEIIPICICDFWRCTKSFVTTTAAFHFNTSFSLPCGFNLYGGCGLTQRNGSINHHRVWLFFSVLSVGLQHILRVFTTFRLYLRPHPPSSSLSPSRPPAAALPMADRGWYRCCGHPCGCLVLR